MRGGAARAGDEAARERVRLYGTDEPPPERRVLRAGPLSAELEDGQLRYVRFGGVEIVRAVAFVVRDTAWGTAAPEIADLSVEQGEGGFHVAYRAACRTADGTLRYAARIEADANALRFSAEGAAEGDFATNRTGFVVLHPLDGVAGAPLAVTHADGRDTRARFPDLVAPWQPATDIRALRHEPAPGLSVAIRFGGDAFEMEDHRNWGDASFKTYVRPLARGFPYTLPAGEPFAQAVEIAVEGTPPPRSARRHDAVRVAVGPRIGPPPERTGASPERTGAAVGQIGRLPAIRLALDAEDADGALAAVEALATLRPQGLNARFDARRHGEAEAARLGEMGRALGVPITLEAVVAGREPEAELAALSRALAAAGLAPAELFVAPARDLRSRPTGLPPGEASFEAIAAAARAAFPGARIGGGSLSYFTEFNRNPPPPGLDFVSHSFAANVHAADDRSVVETLEAVPHIARSARVLAGDAPYRIGFAAIAMREAPYGAGPVPNPGGRRLAATRHDPRHRALFGAAWALGFAARAAEAGAEALALATPTGAFGLLERSPDGEGTGVTPLYAVVRGLAAGAGSPRRDTASDHAAVAALAHEAEGGVALWLANLSPTPRAIALAGFAPTRLRLLDGDPSPAATAGPDGFAATERPFAGPRLTLGPYAVARLHGEPDAP